MCFSLFLVPLLNQVARRFAQVGRNSAGPARWWNQPSEVAGGERQDRSIAHKCDPRGFKKTKATIPFDCIVAVAAVGEEGRGKGEGGKDYQSGNRSGSMGPGGSSNQYGVFLFHRGGDDCTSGNKL